MQLLSKEQAHLIQVWWLLLLVGLGGPPAEKGPLGVHDEYAVGGQSVDLPVGLPLGRLLPQEDVLRGVEAGGVDPRAVRRTAVDEDATGEAGDGRLLHRLRGRGKGVTGGHGRRRGRAQVVGAAAVVAVVRLMWVVLLGMVVVVAIAVEGSSVLRGGAVGAAAPARVEHHSVNHNKVNGIL